MAEVTIDELPQTEKDELLCVYSAMILHDSGLDVSADSITTLIGAAGASIDSFYPTLFAKALGKKDMGALLTFGSGGGGAGPAAAGGAAGGGDAGAATEAKKEEKKVEEEEEEEDMDLTSSAEQCERVAHASPHSFDQRHDVSGTIIDIASL
eukprot:CAMPEP_0179303614 /NCGR_PEP_ID=MMETSP0797-20121207/48668_1 /TAXON_ID=47934 /ORGANISM="Dinophysis acuminata, Strain DAEP01" /LENGTH=151 /DNA_ID=CAMNT_0021013175 /DNA_START=66 /DNA_END=519 /DNA_ORIENTATION=+